MEEVPSCCEHMSMVWETLKEAQCNKLNVANICLDIANAHGSIPNRLIFLHSTGIVSTNTGYL